MIGADTLRRLLDAHPHAISLYIATDPGQRDARAPADRLREQIDAAEAALARRDAPAETRAALIGDLRALASGIDFARHRDPAIALFVAPGFGERVALPEPVAEAAIAGAHFHIKPLLKPLARNRRFCVLALSAGQARLHDATPFTFAERRLKLAPEPAPAEARGDAAAPRHAPLLDHLRRVADAAAAELATDNAPVLLAAEPEAAGHFRKLAALPRLLDATLDVNPFALASAELHQRATALLRPVFDAETEAVLEQIRARLGTAEPTVAIRLEEIVAAAAVGRVDIVVVAEDQEIWGRFDAAASSVHAHGTPSGADEDLLNLAAILTLRTGGRALATRTAELPRSVPAVAALRY